MSILDSMTRMVDDYMSQYGLNIIVDGNEKIGFFKEYDDKLDSEDNKYIITNVNVLKQGSIINALGHNWIVVHKPQNYYKNYDKGAIRLCKYSIKFNFNGEVKEFPSVIDTGTQGIINNTGFNIVDGKIMLVLQENEITKKIKDGQRFIKMGYAWKVTGKSSENEGLIYIFAEKDMFNNNDDKINEIADAFENNTHNYTLEILNTEKIIKVNETLQLNIIAKDNGVVVENPSLIYMSSNSSIATITETGLITAIGAGSVTVTVKYNNVERTLNLIVESAEGIKETEIKMLNEENNIMYLNESNKIQLNYQIYKNGEPVTVESYKVDYYSSDETILTVEEKTGLVTGLKEGKAIITVRYDLIYRDTLEIEVKKHRYIPPTIEITGLNSVEVGKEITLNTIAKDDGEVVADAVVTWISNNENIATINNGVVLGVATGTVDITATWNGVTASKVIEIIPASTGGEGQHNGYKLELSSPRVELTVGQTATISAKLFKDGVEVTGLTADKLLWEREGSVSIQTKMNNWCSARGNIVGEGIIKCTLVEDNLVFTSINLKVI
ncbi:hypothetical protein GCM10008905_16460 [Clostridium malenominatum]|uniref:BIG2 domain-containing protein n=1 Tax=Clostridium malenominatum TaxID=1539 RepID=A0ABN1IXV8_9CLOT